MPDHFANVCMFGDRDFMFKVGKCPAILQTFACLMIVILC